MKLVLFEYLVIFLLAGACNNKADDTSRSKSQTQKPNKISPINCYRFANMNDTIILKLIHVGEAITGTLVYKLHAKDKNMGTIQGYMRGDVLLADYTFMSEGVKSIRQIAFKKVGNILIEGYGETMTMNDRVLFKNTDSLQFDSRFKLGEINCQ